MDPLDEYLQYLQDSSLGQGLAMGALSGLTAGGLLYAMTKGKLNKMQRKAAITRAINKRCKNVRNPATKKDCIKNQKKKFGITEAGFEGMPKGWTKKSITKAGRSLAKTVGDKSPKEKGFFKKCVKRMRKHMGDGAEGYCASLKDEAYGSTYWRGKKKPKKVAQKLTSRIKNV